MGRTGSASLPLHGGHVPRWLSTRMAALGRVLTEAIVHAYGRDELLRRLANPFWFQSFGAVMGMDWHSSGITTSVLGALKRGLAPISAELGIHVCGGRGKHSRQTPSELVRVGDLVGVDGAHLARTSRLVAKVDGAAIQDGYALYLHAFIVTDDGKWTVVQQGMNPEVKLARRYHWLSEGLTETQDAFLNSPHSAVEGRALGKIINLADARAKTSRVAQLQMVNEGPDRALARMVEAGVMAVPSSREETLPLPFLQMPVHHEVRPKDVIARRLHGALASAAERGPKDFTELLLTPGVGARTLTALALTSEVVHGTPCRFSDPARFSLAHGGKDGHPFPVPLRVYDRTISVWRQAVDRARLGQSDKLAALRSLDEAARRLERVATGPTVEAFIQEEKERAHALGGRTVIVNSNDSNYDIRRQWSIP